MGGRLSGSRWRAAIPIATTARHSAQQIAFNEVGRQAIMADPDWNDGNYYGKKPPARGLAVARMVGHITYMSDDSMREKFGRRLRDKDEFGFDFDVDFEVESYLRYRGSQFVDRFDANSYLYITKAMDYFDLTNGHGSLAAALRAAKARFLVISFTSDWLYPSYQSLEIVQRAARRAIATWPTASCSRTTGTMRSWWMWRSRRDWSAASWPAPSRRLTHERSRAKQAIRRRTAGPQRFRHHQRTRRAEHAGARPGLRRRRAAGVARRKQGRGGARRRDLRAQGAARHRPRASRSTRAISTRGWRTTPTRRSIT